MKIIDLKLCRTGIILECVLINSLRGYVEVRWHDCSKSRITPEDLNELYEREKRYEVYYE